MAENTASSDRPQPVLYSQLVTVLAAGLGLATAFGLKLNADQQKAILAIVSALVPVVALAAAAWARRKVTPLSDPRDSKGRRLVVEPAEVPRPTPTGGAEPPVIAPPGGPTLPPPPPSPGRAGRRRDEHGRWT